MVQGGEEGGDVVYEVLGSERGPHVPREATWECSTLRGGYALGDTAATIESGWDGRRQLQRSSRGIPAFWVYAGRATSQEHSAPRNFVFARADDPMWQVEGVFQISDVGLGPEPRRQERRRGHVVYEVLGF